jgi:hypothetical protein
MKDGDPCEEVAALVFDNRLEVHGAHPCLL